MINIQNLVAQSTDSQKNTPQERSNDQKIDSQLERLNKALGLSQEQLSKIKPLLQERMQKREAIRSENEKLHEHLKELKDFSKNQEEKLKSILSPEQFEKYSSRMAQMKDHFKHRNLRNDR
jgi:regulator of replication initiation timing